MSRDPGLYLDDLLESIARISRYTEGMNEATFATDSRTQDAVIRNLEVIGEAARSLPEELRAAAPEIEWRKIVALRNVLAHAYFGLSLPILWDVVMNKLGPLRDAASRLLGSLPARQDH
jgi:uncharacterized protein with HEPN domain